MHGSVGQRSTVRYVWYRWCWCTAGTGGGGRGPGSISGAGGFARRLCCDTVLLLLLSLVSGCGLMRLIRLRSGLFGAVCVALFPPLQCTLVVSCRCWLLGASFVCSCSCVVGPHSWAEMSVLEFAFWGFLLSFALLHLFPPLRIFVTNCFCNMQCYKETRWFVLSELSERMQPAQTYRNRLCLHSTELHT